MVDYIAKIIILGDSEVGKSTCIGNYVGNCQNVYTTIGVNFECINKVYKKKKIKYQIWDTAGQEKFRSIIRSYYRNSTGIILVFDITDKKSFDNITEYVACVHEECTNSLIFPLFVLLGNKIDVNNYKRKVSFEEASDYAKSINAEYHEISAKTNTNLHHSIDKFLEKIFLKIDEMNTEFLHKDEGVRLHDAKTLKSRCC